MQVSSPLHVRGRIMSIYTLLTLGSTVVGGPFVGWVCQQWNPRAGLGLAGVATVGAAVVLALVRVRAMNATRRVLADPQEAAQLV
jgi:MFS family permease